MPRQQRKRAANGTGSVYRFRGGWAGRLTVGKDETGKPIRKVVYGRTQAETQARMIALKAEYGKGIRRPVKGRTPTLAQAAQEWLDSRETSRNERTVRRNAEMLAHALPTLGNVQVDKLTVDQVDAVLRLVSKEHVLANGRKSKGLAPRGVAMVKGVLSNLYSDLLRRGPVAYNPAQRAILPTRMPEHIDPYAVAFSREEALRLVEAAKDDRHGSLYTFLLATGLRLGEALGLHQDDVDLEGTIMGGPSVLVHEQLQRLRPRDGVPGKLALSAPKTVSSGRRVALSNVAVAALRAERERELTMRLAALRWDENWDGLVFRSARGKPLDGPQVTMRYHVFCRKAGLPDDRRIHFLRHTFATLALAAGVNVVEVSNALGHKRVSMTLDIYSHPSPAGLLALASTMDKLLVA